MRKKILSLCMVLVLCLSLLPATALAAGRGDDCLCGSCKTLTGSAESPGLRHHGRDHRHRHNGRAQPATTTTSCGTAPP